MSYFRRGKKSLTFRLFFHIEKKKQRVSKGCVDDIKISDEELLISSANLTSIIYNSAKYRIFF